MAADGSFDGWENAGATKCGIEIIWAHFAYGISGILTVLKEM